MDNAIAWLASLPEFMIYAIIGGVAGGVSTILFFWAPPKYAKFAVIIAIVVSTQITSKIALPKLAQAQFKAEFLKGVGETPRQIDDITILKSASISQKQARYNYEITVAIDDIEYATSILSENLYSREDCKILTRTPKEFVTDFLFTYQTNLGDIGIPLKAGDCR